MIHSQPPLSWLIKNSLVLDFKFWRASKWSIGKKIVFFLKKYFLLFLLQTGIKTFSLGKSFVTLFQRKIFFDSRFGLAGYQSVLARHQNMINIVDIKRVQTMVDIGANVGFFSIFIRDRFPKAIIYAIEPAAKTFQALKNNFQDDNKTQLTNRAITNFCGYTKIVFDEKNSAVSHLIKNGAKYQNGIENVKTQTLDRFAKNNNIDTIDILKIDVETFEKHVLEKAKTILAKTHYLFLEITMENNKNYTFSELINLLYNKGRYNFQLKAFRNFLDKGEGQLPWGDFLFENIYFKKT